ncbi:hypothetical protein HK104_009696, partial [Borealophlyctis nickersoniae]
METDHAALLAELRIVSEHNVALLKENMELKKAQSTRTSADPRTGHLEHLEALASRLQEDAGSFEAEAARLRKQVDDLNKKLEREVVEHAEARAAWLEKERRLMEALRTEKEAVKELRELSSRQQEELNSSAEALSHRPDTPENRNDEVPVAKLEEEIVELKGQVEGLTTLINSRDSQIRRQEDEIVELHSTIGALMDELETNYERVQFELPIAAGLVGALSHHRRTHSDANSDDGSSPNSSPLLHASVPPA